MDATSVLPKLIGEERKFKGKKYNESGLLTQFNNIRFIYTNEEGDVITDEKERKRLEDKGIGLTELTYGPDGDYVNRANLLVYNTEVFKYLREQSIEYMEKFRFFTSKYPEKYYEYGHRNESGVGDFDTPMEPRPDIQPVYQLRNRYELPLDYPAVLPIRDPEIERYYRLQDDEVEKFTNKSIPLKDRIRKFKELKQMANKFYESGGPNKGSYKIVKIIPPYTYNEWKKFTEKINGYEKREYDIAPGVMYQTGAPEFWNDKEMYDFFKAERDRALAKSKAKVKASKGEPESRVIMTGGITSTSRILVYDAEKGEFNPKKTNKEIIAEHYRVLEEEKRDKQETIDIRRDIEMEEVKKMQRNADIRRKMRRMTSEEIIESEIGFDIDYELTIKEIEMQVEERKEKAEIKREEDSWVKPIDNPTREKVPTVLLKKKSSILFKPPSFARIKADEEEREREIRRQKRAIEIEQRDKERREKSLQKLREKIRNPKPPKLSKVGSDEYEEGFFDD